MSEALRKFETGDIATAGKIKEYIPFFGINGDFKTVEGKDALIVRVRNLLLTPLGTYPFDPNYGSLLHKQLFEFEDQVTEKAIFYEVKTRINNYIDGITVESVSIKWNRTQKLCNVSMVLKVLNDVNKTPLSVAIQQYGNSMYGSVDDPVFGQYKF